MDSEVLAAHEERLKHLRVQEARFGISTPPEIKSEIAHIEKIIAEAHQSIDFGGSRADTLPPLVYQDISKIFKKIISIMRNIEEFTDTCKMFSRILDEEPDYEMDYDIISKRLKKITTELFRYFEENILFLPKQIEELVKNYVYFALSFHEPSNKEDLQQINKIAESNPHLFDNVLAEMRRFLGFK